MVLTALMKAGPLVEKVRLIRPLKVLLRARTVRSRPLEETAEGAKALLHRLCSDGDSDRIMTATWRFRCDGELMPGL